MWCLSDSDLALLKASYNAQVKPFTVFLGYTYAPELEIGYKRKLYNTTYLTVSTTRMVK